MRTLSCRLHKKRDDKYTFYPKTLLLCSFELIVTHSGHVWRDFRIPILQDLSAFHGDKVFFQIKYPVKFYLGLCKKSFIGASHQIIFFETRHFNDFARRNR